MQVLVSDAAGHGGYVVHIRLGHHGRHGGVHVARLELVAAVRIPQRGKVRNITHQGRLPRTHWMLPSVLVRTPSRPRSSKVSPSSSSEKNVTPPLGNHLRKS